MAGKILLTGGAGYIGSHTYCELVEAGFKPVILDNFSNSRPDVLDRLEVITGAPVTCYTGDVLDRDVLDKIFTDHEIAAVVHFAALKAVGESAEKPLDYIQTNVGGLITLLDAMRDAGVWRLVFSSSATVYGQPEVNPVREDAPRTYASTYAFTKLASEQILEQVAAADARWSFGILRYFNPVGAHDTGLIGEDPNGIPNNLMPYIAKVATGELERLSVFGTDYDTPDGTGVRDYIHVVDLARGHVQSLQSLISRDESHTVNIGTGAPYSVFDVLHAFEKACGKDLPYTIAPRRAGDVSIYYADPSRASELLGFRAERDLDNMCETSWNWVSRRTNT